MPHSSKELNMLKASIVADPDRSPYFIGKDYAALETEGDIQSAALKLIATLPDIEQTTARKEINTCTSSFVLTKLVGQLYRDKVITEHQEKQEKINREKEQAEEAAKKAEQEAAARNAKIALEIEQQNIAAEQIRETKETEAIIGFILYLLASLIIARVLAAAISEKIKGLIQTVKQTTSKMTIPNNKQKLIISTIIASITGALLSLILPIIPTIALIVFLGTLPITISTLKEEGRHKNIPAILFVNTFYSIATSAPISILLLLLGGILHLLGLPFSTYSSYLLGTP